MGKATLNTTSYSNNLLNNVIQRELPQKASVGFRHCITRVEEFTLPRLFLQTVSC